MDIIGPQGNLEACYDSAGKTRQITAILCHPHPQYGGSMFDGVLQTAADVLLEHGVDCLRFNFRGVGASAGSFDNGIGEADDLASVSAWVGDNFPEHEQWWLGYSFGSSVVWQAVQSGASIISPERIILIAPPMRMMDFKGEIQDIPIQAVAGERDDFVDVEKLQSLPGVTTYLLSGADHFFSGQYPELAKQLALMLK